MADLTTMIPVRRPPIGPIETFSAGNGGPSAEREVTTEEGAVAAGGPPADPDYPTFADGHEAALVGDAIARSAADGGWASVERERATSTR